MRGVYRGIYSALPDDPEFQWLPAHARLLLYTLRVCKQAGPGVIFRYYLPVLSAQTGLTVKQVETSLATLQEHRWIEYDPQASVVWVRNGLRFDPYLNLANARQRKGVERAVAELPKSQVVLNFCDYYKIAKPFVRVSEKVDPLSSPSTEYRVPSTEYQAPRNGPRPVVLTDDQFLESLRRNPAYQGIDLDRELGRMDAWLSTHRGRKKTRRFVINWLNRIDQPVEDPMPATRHQGIDLR